MAGKQKKPQFLTIGAKIAAILEKSGMEFDQQCAAIEVAKLIITDSDKNPAYGGAQ